MSEAILPELRRLDYARNVRLNELIQKALSELGDESQELERERHRSERDVSSVFLERHLNSPQRILPNNKQTHAFIQTGECTIDKVCLRGRELTHNEKVILVTDDHGLLEGYVAKTIPAGKYYNREITTLIIKKCET